MLLPMLALVLPVELGAAGRAPGPTDHSLMMLSHVAMVGGMVALMAYRRDRYAHGARGQRHERGSKRPAPRVPKALGRAFGTPLTSWTEYWTTKRTCR